MERSLTLLALAARCALIGLDAFGPGRGLARGSDRLSGLFGQDGHGQAGAGMPASGPAEAGARERAAFDATRAALDVLPGATAARMCALAGFNARGVPGALAAFTGFCLPGAALTAALIVLVPVASREPMTALALGALAGAGPAFCLFGALGMYRSRPRPPILAVLALGAAGLFWLGLKPFSMLLGGAVIGVLMLGGQDGENAATRQDGPETPSPARYRWRLPVCLFALFALMAAGFFLSDPALGRIFLASAKAETWGLGGLGAPPVFFADAVRVRHWLDQDEFAALLSLTRLIPGPELALPALAGHAAKGWPGALAALAGALCAGLFLVLAAAPALDLIRRMEWADKAMSGLTAVLAGLCLGLAARLASDLAWDAPRLAAAVAALAFLAFRSNPAAAALGAALAGLLAGC